MTEPRYLEVYDVDFGVKWTDDELHVALKLGYPDLYEYITDKPWEAAIEGDRYTKAEQDNISQTVESKLREVGLNGRDKFEVFEVRRTLRDMST